MAQTNGLIESLQRQDRNDIDRGAPSTREDIPCLRQFDVLMDFLVSKPASNDDLAEEVIRERIRLQKATLTQILSLIAERERIRQQNLASIAAEIMDSQSKLYIYRCCIYPISPDKTREGSLERALSELENRARQEKADCWKDTLELWQEALRSAAEYGATVRKAKMLLIGQDGRV